MRKEKIKSQKVYPKCCMCKFDREVPCGVFNKLGGEFPVRLCGAQAHKYQSEVFNNEFCQCVFEEKTDLYIPVGSFHSLAESIPADSWFSIFGNTRAYVIKKDDGSLHVVGHYTKD